MDALLTSKRLDASLPYWVEIISDWSLYHLRPPRKLSASKSLTSSSERSSSGRSGQRGWSSPTKAAHWNGEKRKHGWSEREKKSHLLHMQIRRCVLGAKLEKRWGNLNLDIREKSFQHLLLRPKQRKDETLCGCQSDSSKLLLLMTI